MKKFLLIFAILGCLLGCKGKQTINCLTNSSISIKDEEVEVVYQMNCKLDIISCGVIIKKDIINNLHELNVDNYDIKLVSDEIKDNIFIIKYIPDKEDYNKIISFRSFVVYQDNKGNENILYQDYYDEFNIYEISKKTNNNYADIIVATVEGKLITNIDIVVDTKKYEIKSTSNQYDIKLFYDYNIIKLTISISEGFILDKDFILTVNNLEIDNYQIDNYQIDNNIIIYQFDDPNWTKPY